VRNLCCGRRRGSRPAEIHALRGHRRLTAGKCNREGPAFHLQRNRAGRHLMPADLASRMTLALADAGESRLDRYIRRPAVFYHCHHWIGILCLADQVFFSANLA
jgi:hypothetical protein